MCRIQNPWKKKKKKMLVPSGPALSPRAPNGFIVYVGCFFLRMRQAVACSHLLFFLFYFMANLCPPNELYWGKKRVFRDLFRANRTLITGAALLSNPSNSDGRLRRRAQCVTVQTRMQTSVIGTHLRYMETLLQLHRSRQTEKTAQREWWGSTCWHACRSSLPRLITNWSPCSQQTPLISDYHNGPTVSKMCTCQRAEKKRKNQPLEAALEAAFEATDNTRVNLQTPHVNSKRCAKQRARA